MPQEQHPAPSIGFPPPLSESEWTAHSDGARISLRIYDKCRTDSRTRITARSHTPSAIISEDDGDTVMNADDDEEKPRRIPTGRSRKRIVEWQGDLRAPSPAPSNASSASSFVSGVRDFAGTNHSRGSWMLGGQSAIVRDSLATHQEVAEEVEDERMLT